MRGLGRRAGGRERPPWDHELHLIGKTEMNYYALLDVANGHHHLMIPKLDRWKAVQQESATVHHAAIFVLKPSQNKVIVAQIEWSHHQ